MAVLLRRSHVNEEKIGQFLAHCEVANTRRREQLSSAASLGRGHSVSSEDHQPSEPRPATRVMTSYLAVPTERRNTMIPERQRSGSIRSWASRRSTRYDVLRSSDGVLIRRESVTSSGSQDSRSRGGSRWSRAKRKSSPFVNSAEESKAMRTKRLMTKWQLAARLIIAAGGLIKKHIRTCDYEGSPYMNQLESIDQMASLGISRDHFLFFDPSDFKANKQMKMTYESKRILTKLPLYRTEQEIYYAMIALRSVPSIADFPVRMQRRLAQWGSFECFEPKRIIVRQGDPPFAFYFILYGSVLVCILNSEKSEARTVCYLHRGESFGELAIVNRSDRQSTVISKTYVEMLTISEEAYEQIFMVGGSRTINDPDHEEFMRSLWFLDGWPRHLLVNDPKRFMFCYFQRNAVMARNTNYSKWIFIVKSGSVRVLMKLLHTEPDRTAKHGYIDRPDTNASFYELETSPRGGSSARDIINVLCQYNQIRQRPMTSQEMRAGDPDVVTAVQMRERRNRAQTANFKQAISLSQNMSPMTSAKKQHVRAARRDDQATTAAATDTSGDKSAVKSQAVADPCEKRTIYDDLDAGYTEQDKKLTAADINPQFVHVRTLTKGMIFGLEPLLFDDQPAMSLVSNGAECILLSKQFYTQNAPTRLIDALRVQVSPYPTLDQLQESLLTRLNWDAYKENNLTRALTFCRTSRKE